MKPKDGQIECLPADYKSSILNDMKATISVQGNEYQVDLSKGMDISIPMKPTPENVKAWYLDPLVIEPVLGEGFVGAVAQGGSVNFNNIQFNPHGHGTHTECLGHITETVHSVNQLIKEYHFIAELITIKPESKGEDQVITLGQLKKALGDKKPQAIIFRTLPNDNSKYTRQYSDSNPPYLESDVALELRNRGIKHLLIDTPSVDREVDGGALSSHHAFWNVPNKPRMDATITELIYVPNEIADGSYLLNLSFASFENDASPSKPVLYRLSAKI